MNTTKHCCLVLLKISLNTTLVFKKKEFPRVERCDSDSDENNSDNEEDLMV